MSTRKHLAQRWYGPNGMTIRCRCGQYQPVKGTVREQEDAHRAHRVAMGEQVKPRVLSPRERLEARVAELEDGALAEARRQVAGEIHRAQLPTFPEGEHPDLVARTVRNIHVRIARDGARAPYYTPDTDSEAP